MDQWLERMPARYFADCSQAQMQSHQEMQQQLSDASPFAVDVRPADHDPDLTTVTVVAYDYPAEFSILTGLLSATGFNILSGDIYTSRSGDRQSAIDDKQLRRAFPNQESRARYLQRHRRALGALAAASQRRVIVDTFTGSTSQPREQWARQFQEHLAHFMALLHANTLESLEQAKKSITELVVRALSELEIASERMLFPVDVEFDTTLSDVTRMKILSEDTLFFLYALSNALALHGMSIEHVEIRTRGNRIEDQFDFVDSAGKPVTDESAINQLRLSVAFTKQFTYFLPSAPDPYSALQRFESLIQDFIHLSQHGRIGSLLSSPKILQDLARLLGASDYLWEDFLRLQHESILPMLDGAGNSELLSLEPEQMSVALRRRIAKVSTRADKRAQLNDFKDNQNYLIDLDHIRNPELEFFFLSSRLTALAEAIVSAAVEIAYEDAVTRWGTPRTVAGLRADYAILGLGKLGGEALGYASDIELMYIYSDDGETDGSESIANREFFERAFQDAVSLIDAKREGIFQIDLRLRPHGSSGPVAVSLASFTRYYSREAAALEKLALVRMRHFGGNAELGRHVESIRNQLIYTGSSIDLDELKRLRALQLQEKSEPGRLNAKFSPGGLVDLEYSVQILQVIHGRSNRRLRTPRIHQALQALVEAGKMHHEYAERLIGAYRFFRTLINGLRMLRGNAQDLFLPQLASAEYLHLARRMGYRTRGSLPPAEQLHMEFEARSAEIRAFVERELGRDAVPSFVVGNIADLILSEEIDEQRKREILERGGFQNIERSYEAWRRMAGSGERQFLFAELAILARNVVRSCPDPDMALNNWDRFMAAIADPLEHIRRLQLQPQRLRILIAIFAGSQFLSDTLIQNPDFLDWVTEYQVVRSIRSLREISEDLAAIAAECLDQRDWLNALRRFRRREILRIGTRDICLHAPLVEITEELSNLADALTQAALEDIWRREPNPAAAQRFCVLAFGKLGGRELNYSSDIDLLALFEPDEQSRREADQRLFERVMVQLRAALSSHTEQGYLYRVDLRLRPFGSSGALAQPLPAIERYYRNHASLWEHQAMLKLRPIAGNLDVGRRLLQRVLPLLSVKPQRGLVVASITELRESAIAQSDREADVKNGIGGIRDIEFLVQGLQMLNCRDYPEILTANTLDGLSALGAQGLLPRDTADNLREGYILLRRVEHFLQILEDRQVHRIPHTPELRAALARRVQLATATEGDFFERLSAVRSLVRQAYTRYLIEAAD
ncbi:MAG: glutamate-ammonia-ligase adenylyltransferase [Spirochaetaceae bacterium]|nr:MAG: glutamate-ammonia-ligase adenylyltransferase [Spirochaetaceae bacterium]